MNASALLQVPFYRPVATASAIACPIILIAPEDDNLCRLHGSVAVVDAAKKGELVQLPLGAFSMITFILPLAEPASTLGHFDVYPGQSQYQASLDAQLAFLKTYVPL